MSQDYQFYYWLAQLAIVSTLIPLITGIFRYRYFPAESRILFFLLFSYLILDTASYIIAQKGYSNLYMIRLNTLSEFIFLSLFFIKVFTRKIIHYAILSLLILFIALAGFDLYLHGRNGIDSLSTTIEAILFMIYSLGAFYKLITRTTHVNILSVPLFWFSSGILLYFSGDLILFIFEEFIVGKNINTSAALWAIHSVMHTLYFILITVGFWKTKNI
ncbi:MAG: hypothetical protein JST26_12535 [Bacteroidetes bacterium]|nr:hypothetical protein [Bacteroidota bacterium]